MKNKLLTFLIIGIFSVSSFSFKQDENKPKAKIGTYQFIVLDTKMNYIYTEETFVMIEEKRKESEDITIHLNAFTDVFIPSKKTIEAKNFQALPEYLYK